MYTVVISDTDIQIGPGLDLLPMTIQNVSEIAFRTNRVCSITNGDKTMIVELADDTDVAFDPTTLTFTLS